MSEVNYYQDGSITVTNARAMLGGKTYAMANITSVSMGEKPANRTPGVIVILVGLAIAVCSGAGGSDASVGILVGILALAGGIALAVVAKPNYVVRIGSASGEADALISDNKEQIQKIVKAMNDAIIERG